MHTDNHRLYGTFLSQLSSAIFEWCEEDVAKLLTAKRAEMEMVDKIRPSEAAFDSRITKTEIAKNEENVCMTRPYFLHMVILTYKSFSMLYFRNHKLWEVYTN